MIISRLCKFTQTRGAEPRAFQTTLNSLDRSHRRSKLAFNTEDTLSTQTTMSAISLLFSFAKAEFENTAMPIIKTAQTLANRETLTALDI